MAWPEANCLEEVPLNLSEAVPMRTSIVRNLHDEVIGRGQRYGLIRLPLLIRGKPTGPQKRLLQPGRVRLRCLPDALVQT